MAACNATSSARLAAAYPASGGAYHFGRQVLGPWWGYAALGADLPGEPAPLDAAVRAVGAGWAGPVVTVGAVAACLGALLALLAGVGRTALAMARERDLPPALASVSSAHAVPDVAQVAVGVGAVALVLVADVTTAIGFSSFGVLLYYAVTNLAALRQPAAQRRHVRAVPVVGLAGCLLLAATLPLGAVTAGVVVLVVGLAGRWLALCRRARAADG